jgi:hypothetical protein
MKSIHVVTYQLQCGRRQILWPCSTDDTWTESVIPTKIEIIIHLCILHETSKRESKWIGHILRRNCLLRQVIERKIKGGTEATGRPGRRHGKPLDIRYKPSKTQQFFFGNTTVLGKVTCFDPLYGIIIRPYIILDGLYLIFNILSHTTEWT